MQATLLWRNTAIFPKLGPFDARVVFPIGLWMLHWSYWTLSLAAGAIAGLIMLDRAGIPVNAAVLQLRTLFLGRVRPVREKTDFRRRCIW